MPLSERPRERCLTHGPDCLSLRECLAILLGSGPREKGALGLASSILERPGLGMPSPEEERAFFTALEVSGPAHLHGIHGLGDANRARLLATFEIARRYARHRAEPIVKPKMGWELQNRALQKITDDRRSQTREWLGFVAQYRSGQLGQLCIVEEGVRTHVNTDAVEFFARLLALRPQAFYLFHNHPAGSLQPSEQDLELTRRVKFSAAELGIRLLGHAIVTSTEECWIPMDF